MSYLKHQVQQKWVVSRPAYQLKGYSHASRNNNVETYTRISEWAIDFTGSSLIMSTLWMMEDSVSTSRIDASTWLHAKSNNITHYSRKGTVCNTTNGPHQHLRITPQFLAQFEQAPPLLVHKVVFHNIFMPYWIWYWYHGTVLCKREASWWRSFFGLPRREFLYVHTYTSQPVTEDQRHVSIGAEMARVEIKWFNQQYKL